jgi:hypothetical protein
LWASSRQICTYRAAYWNSSGTLIQLIHKAFLWITAYEAHRDSGRKIKELLLDM